MGCDIHSYVEKKGIDGVYKEIGDYEPFSNRNYYVFGFLANVRNYSEITPIAEQRGLPTDVSSTIKDTYAEDFDMHSSSWLNVSELLEFNYDTICEDRRVTMQISSNFSNGGCTCNSGEGKQMTYREFLGEQFFEDLEELKRIGAERIVFWFDN